METLDDSCYQPSFMDTIIKIIHKIVLYNQLEGVIYLLSHLKDVPRCGYGYGLFHSVRCLINDEATYPLVKNALALISLSDRELVKHIIDGEDIPEIFGINGKIIKFPLFDEWGNETELRRKTELNEIISPLSD